MIFPKAKFGRWYHWKDRGNIPNCKHPGVYLLAHFKKHPPKIVDYRDKNVIYIGETCMKPSKGLWARWLRFEYAAKKGQRGHSGGLTYRKRFGRNVDNLFVSAWPVTGLQGDRVSALIRYVERKLLWDYVERWKKYPKCNKR